MKTRRSNCFYGGLALCFCLMLSATMAQCQPTFGGITVTSGANFEGNNVIMDSFDSADPSHCIWQTGMTRHGMPYGVYSDSLSYSSNSLPSRTSDFTLATDGDIINVGNAQIYGFVNTAPGGSASINKNASVGDLNWVSSAIAGIETGHAEDNMNQVFYSKSLPNPASNGWQINWLPVPTPPGGSTTIGGVTYSLVITNRPANTNFVYYSMGQLTQNIFIGASNVVLYLTNGMDLTGANQLTLNSNSDAVIYSSGNVSVTALPGITNVTENAHALSIYDVAGFTNLVFTFAGSPGPAFIYAPSSSVSFSGGGNAAYSFIGAIFCNSITVAGHYSFHYDESLGSGAYSVPPSIIQQPSNEYAQIGSNATFSVVAGGSPPPTYQWYASDGLVSNVLDGATNSSCIVTNIQSNTDRYSVKVSNPYGSVASVRAGLILFNNAASMLSDTYNAANGRFQLIVSSINNVAGLPYTIQASTNLTDWVPVWTNNAPFSYTDTTINPQRYYRAVFIP